MTLSVIIIKLPAKLSVSCNIYFYEFTNVYLFYTNDKK